MRETYIDEFGTEKFEPNMIVIYLLEHCDHVDLNRIWNLYGRGLFSSADLKDFYQMINYTVGGYEELFEEEENEIL
ncbi:MAG: hypothetical protein KAS36_04440 [Anaerolineales bacterium]|nr:hypothetical protein [Anaerolineales bacterium]